VGPAARVADHVGVSQLESQELLRMQARVHARDDGNCPAGRHGKVALVEGLRELLVRLDQLVRDCHDLTSEEKSLDRSYARPASWANPGNGNRSSDRIARIAGLRVNP